MSLLRYILPFVLALPLFLSSGCTDDIISGEGALIFSEDTVIFDTVFTTIGSVTRQFKVYNPSSSEVTISSIVLAGGQQSKYRINVDGVPGIAFSNITIQGNDSMFIFVDVTLDPNNLSQPALVTDSVIFVTNGSQQDVDLAACGWDAEFYYPNVNLGNLGPGYIIDCNEIWTPAKPIVIYGLAVVDSACTLIIEAGTRIYSHKYSGLMVYREGSLDVRGALGNEVVFASDRLDEFYSDQAGEWNGLYLYDGSNTIMNYAKIKNALSGIIMGALTTPALPKAILNIRNTIIENMAGAALLTYNAKVDAYNCVFGSGGQVSAALTTGGNYNFKHCTFANYWVNGNRQTPALLLSNWFDAPGAPIIYPLNAYFGNCIIYGNNLNEFGTDINTTAAFDFKFERCLMRANTTDLDVSDPLKFVGLILNQDPKFKSPSEHNFQLDTLSPAWNVGYMSIVNQANDTLLTDLLGVQRPYQSSNAAPDLGAYERQE